MKYKVIEKGNPINPTAAKKLYASPVNTGKLTVKDLAKDIAGRSSLTRGDIENVLNNFLDVLPIYLKIGMSVKLGDFGTMRLNLQSEGAEQNEGFNANKIKGVKVIFTPGTDLKQSLEDIKFEEEK